MNTQDFLAFVKSDAQKSAPTAAWRFGLMLFSVVFPFALVFVAGLARDVSGLGLGRFLLAMAILLVVQAAIPFVTSRPFLYRPWQRFVLLMGFALVAVAPFVRLESHVLAGDFHAGASELGCFLFGIFVSGMSFLAQFGIVRFAGPVPDVATRFTLALSAGISGLIALELHCPSTSFGHLIVSHLSHAVVVFPVALALLSWDARLRLKKMAPARA
jgi:hypothetical protein